MQMTTPLERASFGGRDVLLKREDVHELGAFKWRGALPALERYRARGVETVVTASTGNHGAATAWAAARLGLGAVVYAPADASRLKLAVLDDLGADVRLVDGDFDDAKDAANAYATDHSVLLFEDGLEPAQYDGYEAIGAELLEQAPEPPAAVVVPVGNGALFVGIARALRRGSPRTLRVGVVPQAAPAMALSFEAGRAVASDRAATFADGLAVRVPIPEAVEAVNDVGDRMLLVSERAIAGAVADYHGAGIRAEGAAGAPLAALPQLADISGWIVLVVTGRNIDDDLLERCIHEPESFDP
jgi:threonine dehydratase